MNKTLNNGWFKNGRLVQIGPEEFDKDHEANMAANARYGDKMTNHTTNIGHAILMAQDDLSQSEPVAVVSSINEAIDVANQDFRLRIARLERGEYPICPSLYSVWTRDKFGSYRHYCDLDNKFLLSKDREAA